MKIEVGKKYKVNDVNIKYAQVMNSYFSGQAKIYIVSIVRNAGPSFSIHYNEDGTPCDPYIPYVLASELEDVSTVKATTKRILRFSYPTYCEHSWVNTGTSMTFCKTCNQSGQWTIDGVKLV